MPKPEAKKLHQLADALITAIEDKVMLDAGVHGEMQLQFSGLQRLPDSYVAKGFPASAELLTDTLDRFNISYIPEDRLLGGKRITIPFIDNDLESKLADAVAEVESKLPRVSGQEAHLHGVPVAKGKEK